MKKSVFKRWWFWVIVIIVAIGVVANMGGDKEEDKAVDNSPSTTKSDAVNNSENSKQKPDKEPEKKDDSIKSGMHKVGKDIEAGEYILFSTSKLPAYYQVTIDSSGSLDSIISNDNFNGTRYVTVADDQYIELKSAKMMPVDSAPVLEDDNGKYLEGMYKVGRDIPAGEYKAVPDGIHSYVEVSKDSLGTLDSILTNDNFSDEKYVTINSDQYIKIVGCYLVK